MFLTACASTADTPDSSDQDLTNTDIAEISAQINSLPAQSLEDDECGLFGWDTEQDPSFIFFATQMRGLYLAEPGAPQRLDPVGDFPDMTYGQIALILGPGEALIEGVRYKSARLRETLDDGFTRIRPLVVLQTCQSNPV